MASAKLIAYLEANAAKFTAEMERARQSTEKMHKGIGDLKSSLSIIKIDSIVNLATRAYQAGQQIYNLAYSTASLGSEIQRHARTLGMSTDEYQKWVYVAKAADVEQEQFMLGIRVLTKNMGDLRTGTGEAKDALARIGITAKDSSKSIGELLPQIIDRLSKIGNVAEQNQLAMEIFGSRSGLAIANMIREGKNINEITKRFKDLGLAISEDTIEKLAKSEQSFKDFGFVLQSFKAEILAPLVTKFGDLLDFIVRLKKETEKQLEIQLKFTPIISKEDQKVADYYLQMAGFGTERGIEEQRKTYPTQSEKRFEGWGKEALKTSTGGGGGEVRDLFGMTEADHKRSKDNLEWYEKAWLPQWLAGLRSMSEEVSHGMGEWDIGFKEMSSDGERALNQIKAQTEQFKSEEEEAKRLREVFREMNELMIQGATQGMGAWDIGFKDISSNTERALNQQHIATEKAKSDVDVFNVMVKSFGENMNVAWKYNLLDMLKDGHKFSDGMKSMFKGILDSFVNTIQKMITNWLIFGEVTGQAQGATNWGTSTQTGYGGLIGGIGKLIGSFQTGTDYVPKTGLALLHQGERVIPAGENREGGGQTFIIINANDAKSFDDMIKRNPESILGVSHRSARSGGTFRKTVRGF